MSEQYVDAMLVLDDFPANASFWWRTQQEAFGYPVSDEGGWARQWRKQAAAPFFSARFLSPLADIFDEFDIRGKFTLLPCPAGLGRLDRSVRGISPSDLSIMLDWMRTRIVPRFDITLEVLTHSMAYDYTREALLPHSESAWVNYLGAENRDEELAGYFRFGWDILSAVGIHARGLTVGGIADCSGIGRDAVARYNYHPPGLCRTLLAVEREKNPGINMSCLWSLAAPVSATSRKTADPEIIYRQPDGACVYSIYCPFHEILLDVFCGEGDPLKAADQWISADLDHGALVTCAESGTVVGINVHAQTFSSIGTGLGMVLFRTVCHRMRQRYGKRLRWSTPLELIQRRGIHA